MITLSIETTENYWGVEQLFDHSFAPGREALSSYRLRDDVEPISELSLVAKNEFDAVVGAIRYWPILLGDCEKPQLLLGPIAVHATLQGEGLGGQLIETTLRSATKMGFEWVLLIGDAPYYSRFGFKKVRSLLFPKPTNPERILIKSLQKKATMLPQGEVKSVKSVATHW